MVIRRMFRWEINAEAKSLGSSFAILGKDIPNFEVEILEEEKIMGENILKKIMQNWQRENISSENIKRKIINGLSRKSRIFVQNRIKKLMIKG